MIDTQFKSADYESLSINQSYQMIVFNNENV